MKFKHKKAAGFAAMALCCLIGLTTLLAPEGPAETPEIAPVSNTPAPPIRVEAKGVPSTEELPLPTEKDIVGIEFALFEPLPYVAKKSVKRRK